MNDNELTTDELDQLLGNGKYDSLAGKLDELIIDYEKMVSHTGTDEYIPNLTIGNI